jgi:hypothetical protein
MQNTTTSRAATTDAPFRFRSVAGLTAVLTLLGVAALNPPAGAKPEYMDAFNEKYDTRGTRLDSCMTCHSSSTPSKENLNPYGIDFSMASYDFGAIEQLDSDGDGFKNIEEIKALTFPGDPQSNPSTATTTSSTSTTTTTQPSPVPGLPAR